MKVTAQWIADRCGVSRGTVDRVVNGRGNVAPEVRERIQKLVEQYSYRTPAQRQAARAGTGVYRIGFIVPDWNPFFTRCIRDGIRAAVSNYEATGAVVLVEELKNRANRSYFDAIARLEAQDIDGLVIAAPDTLPMAEEITRLSARGISVVTCNSDVLDCNRICHVGQDLIKCGRVAAGLLAPAVEGGAVLVVTGNREFTAHSLRVTGFLDRLHELVGDAIPVNVIECIERYELTYDGVLQQLHQNPHIRGIYMATESVQGCMDALARVHPAERVHVVCNDLTPHARKYLQEGRLDFVIDQDFAAQATRAVEIAAHLLRTGEKPKKQIEYVRTSIITRELL